MKSGGIMSMSSEVLSGMTPVVFSEPYTGPTWTDSAALNRRTLLDTWRIPGWGSRYFCDTEVVE